MYSLSEEQSSQTKAEVCATEPKALRLPGGGEALAEFHGVQILVRPASSRKAGLRRTGNVKNGLPFVAIRAKLGRAIPLKAVECPVRLSFKSKSLLLHLAS
jgi:hypothetical protein